MTEVGQVIGHVRLETPLGAGGMGEVWEGVDERLDRRVAVKAIRSRWHGDNRIRRRFAREARLLSRLEHPNICRLYELLESDGGSYLVMELVRGRTLRQVMDVGLSTTQRMEVATGIGAALAAAHAVSVIHRDLKPENVMLAQDGTAKVLDFGLARHVEDETESTPPAVSPAAPKDGTAADDSLTRAGEVMGTPRAMSPEQARGEPATAASDMYAYGLVLYELFTNQPPYGTDAPHDVMIQRAMWADIPAPTGIDHEVAALIRGLTDLDPGQRPTAVAALERLRHVRGRPLRRLRVLAAAVVAASLVAGTVVSLLALRRAQQEAAAAEATTSFVVGLFRGSDADQGGIGPDATAREIVARGSERLGSVLHDQPATRARLLTALGEIQGNLGLDKESVALLEEALALQERLTGRESKELVPILNALGYAYVSEAHWDEGEATYLRSIAIAERTGPASQLAAAVSGVATTYQTLGRLDEAETSSRRALELWIKTRGEDDPETATARANLAALLNDRGRYEEADGMLERALATDERRLPPDHPDVARIVAELATTRKELGRLDEAEALNRRALALLQDRLGARHPQVALALNNLGVILFEEGHYAEAEAEYRRAVEIAEETFGPEHPYAGLCLSNLAEACHMEGRPQEAEPLYRRALAIERAALGGEHRMVGESLCGLARALADLGRAGEAETLMLEAVRVLEAALGADSPVTGKALGQLGELYLRWNRPEDAARALRRARAILEPALGADHPAVLALPRP
jgi:eukaryotic-like serine/threonine-protein kinase